MTRNNFVSIGFAFLLMCIALVIALTGSEAEAAQPIDNMAVIVVSENTDPGELGKAVAFYEYLLEENYDKDNIFFLTPSYVSGSDGTSNLSNVEDAFQVLMDDDEEDKDVVIYISDHCGGYINGAVFEFSGEILEASEIDSWMDDMVYDDLTFIIGGDRSGLAGPELQSSGRMIISSMGPDEVNKPDQFNITRSLENRRADFNNDGVVSFYEAFLMEKYLLRFEPQTPQIWT